MRDANIGDKIQVILVQCEKMLLPQVWSVFGFKNQFLCLLTLNRFLFWNETANPNYKRIQKWNAGFKNNEKFIANL